MVDNDIRTRVHDVQNEAHRRWRKLTTEDLAQAKDDAQRLAAAVQERYGYSAERAQADVNKFLDRYDSKVYQIAQNLPGRVDEKLMRRPWASLATAFIIGVAAGMATGVARRGQDSRSSEGNQTLM